MTGQAAGRQVPPGPRIPPGTSADTGRLNHLIARAAGLALGVSTPNLFSTLGRNRGLFRPWLRFAARLMPGGRLPRADTELMILRTAENCGSEYEWRAHESLAGLGRPRSRGRQSSHVATRG